MHPHVLEPESGTCPICGMELVRVGKGGAPDEGGVVVDPAVVQKMGVRTERIVRQPLFRHLRTLGEVIVGEDRVSVLNLRFAGWIERIHADKTGEPVSQGDPLFDVYSPDLVATQEEYLVALRAQGPKSELARSARRKLELFDIHAEDLDALARTGRVKRAIAIRAPRSGHILHKNVVEGAHVKAGEDLYTIADLSRIWVQAEVYAFDAPWVEAGQPAQMELTYSGGSSVAGSVSYVYPILNEVSRTLTVRLEFPNPDLRLKPGMFATVYIQFRREDDALVVPSEAILHSGKRELVFLDLGEGRFEPREITTGLVGDRHKTQVLSGLEEGDVVVTSGQFLIDSESQLQEAIGKLRGNGSASADSGPDEADAVYACPMHPEETSHEPGQCGICGMDLEPVSRDVPAESSQ